MCLERSNEKNKTLTQQEEELFGKFFYGCNKYKKFLVSLFQHHRNSNVDVIQTAISIPKMKI